MRCCRDGLLGVVMEIEIIGSESMGVRGLCCFVTIPGKNILIDPGIALGYKRCKLLPHPFQIALDERIRKHILQRWEAATDIVISHFHGDHVPLADANPYQLDIRNVSALNPGVRIWTKPPEALSQNETARAADFFSVLHTQYREQPECGEITFSQPVPHGDAAGAESVMMTRIAAEKIFVHGSDIQLLNNEAVSQIEAWAPDIALVGGPPLYLGRLTDLQVEHAWHNAVRLVQSVGTLILDHHLMRDMQGAAWLENLSRETGREVMCAADFMNTPRMMLEAERVHLYEDMPVSGDWHASYEKNRTGADIYWNLAAKLYKQYELT